MSRAYRVKWETASRTVRASDRLRVSLQLLGILDEAEMIALLRAELARDGWQEVDDTVELELEGARVRLEPDGKAVTVELDAERTVSARADTKAAAAEKVREAADRAHDAVAEDATRRLTRLEPELRARLGEAVQRVYVEALQRKATQLGAVESVQESTSADGEYELVIKVKT
jgi:hypothetical protein